ncbi:MAG: LysR family transcriptional regulator [Bdellovibrionota bacterium]
MLPNFYDLKYFLMVAKTLNISRASERLGVSQPSLSTALKRLEDVLGVQLLIRSKTGVQLSNEGKAFELKAQELLKSWEELTSTLHKSHQEPHGHFTLGAHTSVALYSTPHFLPALLDNYHKLELRLVHGLSRIMLEKVISFELDAALVINPIRHPDLVLTELGTDEVSFYVSPKCSTERKKILICDLDLNQSHDLVKKATQKGLIFDRILESKSLEWISEACADGLGVALLPSRVAKRDPTKKLKLLSPKSPVYKDKLFLAYRADHLKSPASKKIIHQITSGMRESFK